MRTADLPWIGDGDGKNGDGDGKNGDGDGTAATGQRRRDSGDGKAMTMEQSVQRRWQWKGDLDGALIE